MRVQSYLAGIPRRVPSAAAAESEADAMASVQAAEVNTRVHDVGESVQSAIVLIVQAQASEGGTTVSAEVVKVPIRAHAAGVSGQSAIALIVVERALAEKTLVSAEAEEVNTSVRGVTEKDLSDVAARLCGNFSHVTRRKEDCPSFGGGTEQQKRGRSLSRCCNSLSRHQFHVLEPLS